MPLEDAAQLLDEWAVGTARFIPVEEVRLDATAVADEPYDEERVARMNTRAMEILGI